MQYQNNQSNKRKNVTAGVTTNQKKDKITNHFNSEFLNIVFNMKYTTKEMK